MSKPGDQMYGWTGPTPVGVGYASFIQIFDHVGLTRFVVRNGDGVCHHIDIPSEQRVEMAKALLKNVEGYYVRYLPPSDPDTYSCGCDRGACICDFA